MSIDVGVIATRMDWAGQQNVMNYETSAEIAPPLGLPSTPRVLIVDDDAAIREFLRDFLDAEGFVVDEASNGAEAVELARALRPAAVLMDLMMPIVSGAEATAMLKRDPSTADIPILAMSAGRNLATMADGVPADGFVNKPFDLTALTTTLARLTSRGL